MKFFTKKLPAMMVVLSVAAVVLTGCGNVSNSNDAVDAKMVVEQSVAAMEKMMAQPSPASQANVTGPHYSVVMPNSKVDYESTRQRLIMASSISMYMAEYLAQDNILENGKLYEDSFVDEGDQIAFVFRMDNITNGVKIAMNLHINNEMTSNVMLHFYYDYKSKQPMKSIFTQFTDQMVNIALFDYTTNEVMELSFSADDPLTLKNHLKEKKLSFTNFSTFGFSNYEIGKLNTKTYEIEVYKYLRNVMNENKLTETVDETKVIALFNTVYTQVKEYLVEPAKLNTTSAEPKEFYKKMHIYASSKAEKLARM